MENYFDMFDVLLGHWKPVALDADLVLDHPGPGDPDDWDYFPASYMQHPQGGRSS